jgi:phenylacetate-CoA ligase
MKEPFTASFPATGPPTSAASERKTPLCIAIRRILYEKDLARDVLGRDEIPSLCQYDPTVFHAELAGEELVVSKYQGAPLLRYRTGDRASLMPYDEMTERLTSAGVDPVKILESRGGDPSRIRNLPFVLAWGRIDGGVTFFGVNILVEQVREIIEGDDRFRECCTGQFQIRKTERGDLDQVLEILLEPRPGIRGDADALAEPMVEALSRTSAEYAAVRKNQGDKALPKLLFVEDRELFGGTKFRYAR